MKPRLFAIVFALGLLLCAVGCETTQHFSALTGNLVGDEFHILCQSYSYHELVGAHIGTISNRRFWMYRVDLADRQQFKGRSWTKQEMQAPGDVASRLDEARLVSGSPLVVVEHFLWDEEQYELQRWELDTHRLIGPIYRIPGNSDDFYNTSGFISPPSLHAFTGSGRRLVVHENNVARVKDVTTWQQMEVPGLTEMINRCAAVGRTSSEQTSPRFTEDLRFLLIVPKYLVVMPARPNPHRMFELAGRSYSFNDYGYYGDRKSQNLEPFTMRRDGKCFLDAESDGRTLLTLYTDQAEILHCSLDGSFQTRTSTPPAMSEDWRDYARVYWDTPRARLVIWRSGELIVWDYKAGRTRVLHDPTANARSPR